MMTSRKTSKAKMKSKLTGLATTAIDEIIVDYSFLPGLLNGAPVKAEEVFLSRSSLTRVLALITALQEASKQLKEEWDTLSAGELKTDIDVVNIANELLAAYQTKPVVRFTREFDLAEGAGDDSRSYLQIDSVIQSKQPFREQIVVRMIIDMINRKKFYLLRQCGVCNTWFLASRSDQVTCSVRCRDKVYRQTEEYKLKQRELMRKKYHEQKKAKTKVATDPANRKKPSK